VFQVWCPGSHTRNCNQDGDQKNKGPNYVLKDENTQRGGNHRRRSLLYPSFSLLCTNVLNKISYFDNPLPLCRCDLVFDEDDAGYSDKKDHENGHRRKIQRKFFLNEQARDSADFIDRGEVTDRGQTKRPLQQPKAILAKGSTLGLWPPPLSRPKPHL
jgi:hypothetical protein